ncbi:MAG: tRNA (guanosine(37)-N1)-methyltransferase TrmD [Alphaproteobacteria bacterium]|jgi:tRNA (guanine37-N1)-methyltransferase|nr:tRNA (guanosine(37)-N1)-methyltransferase TrmD [Alphaproteobacteria bacterium]
MAPVAAPGRPWTARVVTLFPEMFPGPLGVSLAGKALARGDWALETVNIRDFAGDRHRTVDDAPAGGGAGMVMRPDVVDAALDAAKGAAFDPVRDRLIHLSPRGRPFDQALAHDLAGAGTVVLLCGRYEGVDQRVLDAHDAEEISIGDFVLSGGEPAAFCIIDAIVRLLPGVMGNVDSAAEESFGSGARAHLLEHPHYTRPARWIDREGRERPVPEVLLSGHHARVRAWRLAEAERITRLRRPDLWQRYLAAAGRPAETLDRP